MKLILTSLLFCVFSAAQAQEITYNAVIQDRKGVPVRSITAGQLELTDAGNLVKATVRLYDGDSVVDGGERKPTSPQRRMRLIPVVFEGLNSEQRRLAKQIALDLFKEDKDPNHLFAVFILTNQMNLLAPFTTDRAALRQAVELATSGSANTRFAEASAPVKAKLTALAAASSSVDFGTGGIDSDPAAQGYLARLQLAMLSNDVIDDSEAARRSISFLNSLSTGMKMHPGRKAIAYLTAGLFVSTNLDVAFEALHARANNSGVSFYPIDCSGVTVASLNAPVVDAVNAASVDLSNTSGTENRERGDRPNGIENAVEALRSNSQTALRVLAEATGGVMMVDSNDPKRLLRELISGVQTYYELTYDPQIKDYNGALRRTSLKVKDADVRVRDRDGYLAMPPGQENLLPYELPLLRALGTAPLVRDVEFRSGTWKLKAGKERFEGVVAVEVPFAGIAFAQDPAKGLYAARLSLVIQIKNTEGKIVERFSRDLPLKGKLDQLELLKANNFNFRERFAVANGRYTVETAVMDQLSKKMGARRSSLVAAASSAILSISSVTLVRGFQPSVKDLSPDDPFQYRGGRITPTLNNVQQAVKGGQLALFFTVHPDRANTAPVQAMVQYIKDGAVAGTANFELPAPDAKGRIPYVLSSPMDGMSAGEYEVKVMVKQGAAGVAESAFLTIGAS